MVMITKSGILLTVLQNKMVQGHINRTSEVRSCKDCLHIEHECEETKYWGTEGFKFFLQAINCEKYINSKTKQQGI